MEELTEAGWCFSTFHPGQRPVRQMREKESKREGKRKNKGKLCSGPFIIITGEGIRIKM